MSKKLLVIGQVIPEPQSSAAGVRILQLIDLFQVQGFDVVFATAAQDGEHPFLLEKINVSVKRINLNCSSFDDYVKELSPTIVLFDRYMTEEQYGWRVAENCPQALRILDSEDLHCLRNERENCIKKSIVFQERNLLQNKVTKREIASIYRCDLTLIISKIEMNILINIFSIKEDFLFYIPLFVERNDGNLVSYDGRSHFISIGNFLHPPNWDAVQVLKNHIWSKIRAKLPQAELHIYGAYTSQKVMQLHNEKEGFIIKGWTDNAQTVVENAKVMLAPMRYGAGLKGKLLQSMQYGTPNVTTNIGAEGLCNNNIWNGYVSDDWDEFVEKSILLYQEETIWKNAQSQGTDILNNHFTRDLFEADFLQKIKKLQENIENHRQLNFIGTLLYHHTFQSTKYMSRWIEEKNKK